MSLTRHVTHLLTASLLSAGLVAGVGVVTAPTASADPVCLPVPGVPCLPDPGLPGAPGPLTATTPVTVSGTPKVGMTLTATPPTWSDDTATTTYQWQRDGQAIADATMATYVVAADDVDHQLTVLATGSADLGLSTGTSQSTPALTGVQGDAPKPGTDHPITQTGTPTPGQTLTVDPGVWTSGGTELTGDDAPTFTYQWYRSADGGASPISGATTSSYQVAANDVGHRIVALVTATRDGYAKGQALGPVSAVPKYATAISFSLARSSIHSNQRGLARVVVQAADGSAPSGRLVLRQGSKILKSYALSPSADGRTAISLPKFKAGRHALRIIYAGNASLQAATSRAKTLTVRSR